MSDQADPATEPSERDRENAARRQAIADEFLAAYTACLKLAQGAFGPGWYPSHRHYLVDHDEEEKARREGGRPREAAVVYTVKNRAKRQRHFTVSPEGQVVECASYQAGFGDLLTEPHPTRGFTDQQGAFHHVHRYSLCWAAYHQYRPKSADQLASLRASRERGKSERAEAKFVRDSPLLAWAEQLDQEAAAEDENSPGR